MIITIYLLGIYYAIGEGVTKDQKEAVAWYHKAAKQGNSEAQYLLGKCYLCGDGIDKDEQQAIVWCEKAANQNHTGAKEMLKMLLVGGKLASFINDCTAKMLAPEPDVSLKEKAESGDASSQALLGDYYSGAIGVKVKDEKKALTWYQKAAEQGNPGHQRRLGTFHEKYGDLKEAVVWYRKAAEQGEENAQFLLGECYRDGRGIDRDEKQAVIWCRKAADNGSVYAQFTLGKYYECGFFGVEKDEKQAFMLYQQAAAGGLEKAQEIIQNRNQSQSDEIKHSKNSLAFLPARTLEPERQPLLIAEDKPVSCCKKYCIIL